MNQAARYRENRLQQKELSVNRTLAHTKWLLYASLIAAVLFWIVLLSIDPGYAAVNTIGVCLIYMMYISVSIIASIYYYFSSKYKTFVYMNIGINALSFIFPFAFVVI